jgi:acetolactate synthase I/II/III large subunit
MYKKNIANFAVDLIAELGTTTAFTLTGGMAMHINRAVATSTKIKPVYCQHEQACVAAAEGYTKTKDFKKIGLAVVTAGPGVTNTLTSLVSAYGDSAPVVVLAGQIKSQDIDTFGTRTHGVQEVKTRELISPAVKLFTRLNLLNFKKQLEEAIIVSMTDRPGPAFIEIPLDVQGFRYEYSLSELKKTALRINKIIQSKIDSDVNKIKQAIRTLLFAKRPVLHIGNGCRISGINSEVIKFAKKYNIPTVFTWLSFDILNADDKLNFGCPGGLAPIYSNVVLSSADVVLFLGSRLDLGTTAFQRDQFAGQAKRIFIDVDKNELKKFKKLNNTLIINADLKSILKPLNGNYGLNINHKIWLNYCLIQKRSYLKKESSILYKRRLTVYNVAQIISEIAANKVIIPASSGYAEETFTRFLRPKLGTRFFNGAALGSMGLGLPHAIGAACATNKQVLCVEADGGIMMNIQELSTLRNLKAKKFILIILNNSGYESIRSSQNRHFGKVYGADRETGLFIPDFKSLAKSFEINYYKIDKHKNLYKLKQIISTAQSAVLIDIKIDREEYRGPSVKTVLGTNGTFSTTNLKDISW